MRQTAGTVSVVGVTALLLGEGALGLWAGLALNSRPLSPLLMGEFFLKGVNGGLEWGRDKRPVGEGVHTSTTAGLLASAETGSSEAI